MSESKIRVAILSDSVNFQTGFRNQSLQLAQYLSGRGFEVHYFCSGLSGLGFKEGVLEDGTVINFHLHGQHKMPYFQDNMSHLLKKYQIDFFIILLDTFMLYGNDGWFGRIDLSPAQSAFWYPSDGGAGLPNHCEVILKKVDYPVAMSKFAQKQVKDYYGLNTGYIPHGVNPEKIFKLPEEERQKFRSQWGLKDKFVIGTVMRNQGRKMPDKFIKTIFSLANKLKDNSLMQNWVILMHTDFQDQAAPVDLYRLIRRYNLENRIISTGMNALNGFPESRMNEVYNLFDAFFLSTSGEGFGIPIIEAMSAEVPCVVTDYTTTEELIVHNQAGFGAKLVGTQQLSFFDKPAQEYDNLVANGTTTGGWHVERGLVDIDDAADKLIQLYRYPELRKQMGLNGRKAVREQYDFNNIVGLAWENLILSALGKRIASQS